MGQTISTAVDIACYLKAISTAKTQYWVINIYISRRIGINPTGKRKYAVQQCETLENVSFSVMHFLPWCTKFANK